MIYFDEKFVFRSKKKKKQFHFLCGDWHLSFYPFPFQQYKRSRWGVRSFKISLFPNIISPGMYQNVAELVMKYTKIARHSRYFGMLHYQISNVLILFGKSIFRKNIFIKTIQFWKWMFTTEPPWSAHAWILTKTIRCSRGLYFNLKYGREL